MSMAGSGSAGAAARSASFDDSSSLVPPMGASVEVAVASCLQALCVFYWDPPYFFC